MDEIATFSRWKAFFGFFLMRKKKHPLRVERAKKKRENNLGKPTDRRSTINEQPP